MNVMKKLKRFLVEGGQAGDKGQYVYADNYRREMWENVSLAVGQWFNARTLAAIEAEGLVSPDTCPQACSVSSRQPELSLVQILMVGCNCTAESVYSECYW
jgi:hypothetical protein